MTEVECGKTLLKSLMLNMGRCGQSFHSVAFLLFDPLSYFNFLTYYLRQKREPIPVFLPPISNAKIYLNLFREKYTIVAFVYSREMPHSFGEIKMGKHKTIFLFMSELNIKMTINGLEYEEFIQLLYIFN